MPDTRTLVTAIVILALGTYAFRAVPLLAGRGVRPPEPLERATNRAAVVLLLAVAATAGVFGSGDHVSWARTLGVGVAVGLTWRRVNVLVTILTAGAVAALARAVGMA